MWHKPNTIDYVNLRKGPFPFCSRGPSGFVFATTVAFCLCPFQESDRDCLLQTYEIALDLLAGTKVVCLLGLAGLKSYFSYT